MAESGFTDYDYFIRFPLHLSPGELDGLLAEGWFRSHQHVYATSHIIDRSLPTLRRVFWLRYEVGHLVDRRSHRRIRGINKVFGVEVGPYGIPSQEEEELYARHQMSRGFEGLPSLRSSLFYEGRGSLFDTMAIRVRDGGRLVALALFDVGLESGASILHIHDPDYRRHSLGKYLMLLTVDWLKESGYGFYYPGSIVSGNPRLDYKLFLGPEVARCFDRGTGAWLPFHWGLLQPESYTEEDVERFSTYVSISTDFARLGLSG
jgi:arginyl-tRNA--protein-N-Asp/Glu arginylyltransferase